MNRLTGIFRQPDSLVAHGLLANPGETVKRVALPLGELPKGVYARQQQLIGTWERLSLIGDLSPETAADVIELLIETVPDTQETLSPLRGLPAEPRRSSTTSTRLNPRKTSVAKPPGIPVLDLRPYLCDARHKNELLTRLQPFWPEARPLLIDRGYAADRLPASLPAQDPSLWYHYGPQPEQALPTLPEPFRREIAPLLRGGPWQFVVEWLGLYWALGLDSLDSLRLGIADLLSQESGELSRTWARLLCGIAPEHRELFLQSVLRKQSFRHEPALVTESMLSYLAGITDRGKLAFRMEALLDAVERKFALEFLQAGFLLVDRADRHRLYAPTRSGYCPAALLVELADRIDAEMGSNQWIELELWEACGECEDFGAFLESQDWTLLSGATLRSLLRLYGWRNFRAGVATSQAVWQWLQQLAPAIRAILLTLEEEYRQRFIDLVDDLIDAVECENDLIERAGQLLPYFARICAEPLPAASSQRKFALSVLQKRDQSLLDQLLLLPTSSLREYEESCYPAPTGELIDQGLKCLLGAVDRWTLRVMASNPRQLCEAAKLLASLPACRQERVMQAFITHPLMTPGLGQLPAEDSVVYLSEICREPLTNPVPRKLRQHYQGAVTLRPGQVARAWQALREKLPLTQTGVLEQICLDELREGFGVDPQDDTVRHALQMRFLIESNQKVFRRFLRAHWEGRPDYLRTHPRNVEWLSRHPDLPEQLWREGITLQREIDPLGNLHLSVEQNPLEALKLGTYVGSCLSLGGIFAESAVAVVLDVNKQVIYARDSRGNVVARQLVAMSEENELVCFPVYPQSVLPDIAKLFATYDRQFAAALKVKMFRPDGTQHYTVANLLSESWYDDGARDFSKAKAAVLR